MEFEYDDISKEDIVKSFEQDETDFEAQKPKKRIIEKFNVGDTISYNGIKGKIIFGPYNNKYEIFLDTDKILSVFATEIKKCKKSS